MTTTPTTCTVITTATGGKCGGDAVHTFVATDGVTVFAECAAHTTAHIGTPGGKGFGHAVGDHVTVRRYGKTYDAVVTRVARTGTAYATFTYGNGATRTVRVD